MTQIPQGFMASSSSKIVSVLSLLALATAVTVPWLLGNVRLPAPPRRPAVGAGASRGANRLGRRGGTAQRRVSLKLKTPPRASLSSFQAESRRLNRLRLAGPLLFLRHLQILGVGRCIFYFRLADGVVTGAAASASPRSQRIPF